MNKRRDILTTISTGGVIGIFETWQKPVIKSIIVPAHAQTSCSAFQLGPVTASCSGSNPSSGNTFLISVDETNGCPSLSMVQVNPDAIPLEGYVFSYRNGDSYSVSFYIDGNRVANAASNGVSCGGSIPSVTGFPLMVGLNGSRGVYQSVLSITVADDNLSVTMSSTDFLLVDT
ncbi:MAG: hypothetical protein AAF353_00675 [Pseudomonadota bacterium]